MGPDLKVGDLVKVLEGARKGETATVKAIHDDLDYPFSLEFAKDFASYKRYELRKVE